jgi:nucleoside-diphosphate-sugar epimerase
VTLIRPGHTYGEGGPVLHSLGNTTAFLDRIRHGLPLVVHGDGNGLWSALHADDVAQIFAAGAGNPVALGRTYNATGTEWMTWDQYHARVAEALGAPLPELVHIPAELLARIAPDRAAQSRRSLQYPGLYDMTAACADLGFAARVSFVDGMRRTIRWLEAEGRIESWQTDPGYDQIVAEWKKGTAVFQG